MTNIKETIIIAHYNNIICCFVNPIENDIKQQQNTGK